MSLGPSARLFETTCFHVVCLLVISANGLRDRLPGFLNLPQLEQRARVGREEESGKGVEFSVRQRFVGCRSDGSSNKRFWADVTAKRVLVFFIVPSTPNLSAERSAEDVDSV